MNTTNEQTLYTATPQDGRKITVTNSRLILPFGDNNAEKTYALAHINSVYMDKKSTIKEMWQAIGGVIVFSTIIGFSIKNTFGGILSALIFILGIPLAIYYFRAKYCVYISVVSEQVPSYTSNNKEEIKNIVDAINNAIISRS